jgi:thioredoxin-related protein
MISIISCENLKLDKTSYNHHKELKISFPDIDTTLYKSKVFSKEMLISQKPVLIYFNSLACVNCRKMEKRIANTEGLWKEINNRYKFINLYVDDRTLADSSFWIVKDNKMINTIGALNNYAQIELTKSGSNPTFYFFGDSSENNLIGYCNEYNFKDFIKRIKK